MYPEFLEPFFLNASLPQGLMLPVFALLVVALLAVPGMLRVGARPWDVAFSAYAVLAQGIGIIMMSAGALPVLHAVLSGQGFSNESYIGLLLMFAIGGFVFLRHDALLRTVDETSKAVPTALAFYAWRIVGVVISLFALLSLVLLHMTGTGGFSGGPTLQSMFTPNATAVANVVMLLYGLTLSWFTHRRHSGHRTISAMSSRPLAHAHHGSTAHHAHNAPKKKAAKR